MLNPIHNFLQSFLDRAWDSLFYFVGLILGNYINAWKVSPEWWTLLHILVILFIVDWYLRRVK